MSAFTGTHFDPETVAHFIEQARTPMRFEWPESAYNAITFRGVHVIYVLGFEGGIVKVGHTIDFLTRMSANRYSPRRRGAELVCGWRVGTDAPLEDEAVLKRLASELGGTRMGRSQEWFTDVNVRDLIAACEAAVVPLAAPH